ncbi:MAG: MFS transporter, partial [Alphaproteobacteria bacterium]
EVLAVDKSEPRLDRLVENLERVGLTAELFCTDAAALEGLDPFDAVLLDAPCSATGTIRRHPDLPWIRDEDSMKSLTGLQDKLLDRAAALTKPDGTLVYAVCSLEPREGEERIAAFLARHSNFARNAVTANEISPAENALAPSGDVRVLPCHLADQGGMDGFFISRLRRVS